VGKENVESQSAVLRNMIGELTSWANGARTAGYARHLPGTSRPCADLIALRPPYVGHAREGAMMVLLARG